MYNQTLYTHRNGTFPTIASNHTHLHRPSSFGTTPVLLSSWNLMHCGEQTENIQSLVLLQGMATEPQNASPIFW
jgi:hypothetical protein